MKSFLGILTLFLCFNLSSQVVKTFAGTQYIGSGQYNEDPNSLRNFSVDSVVFSAPYGIAVDTTGRIYISNEHSIYWIKNSRAYIAAGSPSGESDSKDFAGIVSRFATPSGLTLNYNKNEILVADLDNNQVRTVENFINLSTQQKVTTLAGVRYTSGSVHSDGNAVSSRFNSPVDVAYAPNGDIYVADRNNHCIRKISGNTVSTIAGSAGVSGSNNGTGSSARFAAPSGLFLDGNDLYVADYGNSSIRKINITNNAVTDFITTGLFGPRDIIKFENAFYIVESLCIKKFENNALSTYAGNPNINGYVNANGTSARFEDLTSIIYHTKDKVFYVVDKGNNTIRSISTETKPTANFTTSTSNATKGQTILLKNTSTNKPTSFRWSFNPSNTYTLLNNSKLTDSVIYVSFNQTGAYAVKLFVSNALGADSLLRNNYLTITSVTASPVANFDANKKAVALNEVVNLIDLSSNGPTEWTWRISPNNFQWQNGTDSNSQFPKVSFSNLGKYSITLIAKNDEGEHLMTKSDFIVVNNTSINSNLNPIQLSIYPNPCSETLNILNLNELYKYQIYNMQGQKVHHNNEFFKNEASIDVSSLNNGIYFLEIQYLGQTKIFKFSVSK